MNKSKKNLAVLCTAMFVIMECGDVISTLPGC